jgi:zinc finger protein
MISLNYINYLTGFDSKYMEPALVQSCQPVIYTLSIGAESDLLTKVIKSKNACVEIPELDIRILPGMNSKDLICDVFGLLSGIESSIKMGQNIELSKRDELLDRISQIKFGKGKATLVLTDPSGLSLIMGSAEKEILNT